ncbi:acyltransferase [Gemmatimonas sp.]|uniref:acyltransferase n=1 Tax=Gemmatimonas sp. TaxID=1962908 RepID=UPI00286E9CAD|nr:acyltransferase [Gemmatimonas sp.]
MFILATTKGHYYKLLYRVLGRRFTAGPGFRVFGSLSIKGPGRVEFGKNVTVWQHVTPWTHSVDALITVGDNTRLAGVRMGCVDVIEIGQDCIVADCRIMDSDFHSTAVNRHSPDAPVRCAPVRLGRNVWVAAAAGVLPGTTIGENSVVSFGSVCSGSFPPNVIVVGNPARIAGKVTD